MTFQDRYPPRPYPLAGKLRRADRRNPDLWIKAGLEWAGFPNNRIEPPKAYSVVYHPYVPDRPRTKRKGPLARRLRAKAQAVFDALRNPSYNRIIDSAFDLARCIRENFPDGRWSFGRRPSRPRRACGGPIKAVAQTAGSGGPKGAASDGELSLAGAASDGGGRRSGD